MDANLPKPKRAESELEKRISLLEQRVTELESFKEPRYKLCHFCSKPASRGWEIRVLCCPYQKPGEDQCHTSHRFVCDICDNTGPSASPWPAGSFEIIRKYVLRKRMEGRCSCDRVDCSLCKTEKNQVCVDYSAPESDLCFGHWNVFSGKNATRFV